MLTPPPLKHLLRHSRMVGHISMQRLCSPHWCAQSSSRFVSCSGWMWLSFVIYMQTVSDARRWRIVSYSNAMTRNIAVECAAAAVHMFVLYVCMHALLPLLLSLWCKLVSVTMPPQDFHLALSDYIAVREEWNPKQSGDLHGSEYILWLLYVLFSICVWAHNR